VYCVEIKLIDLERFRREKYREAFKVIARFKGGSPKVSRRSVSDILKIAELGRRIVEEYFEVCIWGEERVLRLR